MMMWYIILCLVRMVFVVECRFERCRVILLFFLRVGFWDFLGLMLCLM